MARYIDADKLIAYLHREDFYTPDERWKPESEFANMIESTPTADVEEVRHGEWVHHESTAGGIHDTYRCSICGVITSWTTKFCPNCGAKMDGM